MIRIRRFASCLVAALAALAAAAMAAPAAFASIPPPGPAQHFVAPGPAGQIVPVIGATSKHPPATAAVVIGGMPGWQIALIAAAAAVLAAALAVIADRMFAARRTGGTGLGRRPARLGSGTAS